MRREEGPVEGEGRREEGGGKGGGRMEEGSGGREEGRGRRRN